MNAVDKILVATYAYGYVAASWLAVASLPEPSWGFTVFAGLGSWGSVIAIIITRTIL